MAANESGSSSSMSSVDAYDELHTELLMAEEWSDDLQELNSLMASIRQYVDRGVEDAQVQNLCRSLLQHEMP